MALGRLIELLKDHPWRNYVIVNLVLIVLEKLVEHDFVCPCRPGYSEAFFSLYLAMPLLMTLNFGFYMWNSKLWSEPQSQSGCKYFCRCCGKFLTCTVPSVFWVTLFFGDGRFLACVITPLQEDHVDTIALPPWEWCDKNRTLTDEQNHVQISFYISKMAVFIIISITFLGVLIYQFCNACCHCGCCRYCDACCESCMASEQPPAQPPGESNGQPHDESNGQPSGESNGQPPGDSNSQHPGKSRDQPIDESIDQPSHNFTAQPEECTSLLPNDMELKTFSSNQ
ncbi:uncharacterized protein LOC118800186 isoform X1 [Colossoma macropomum]|uniref:uncharacterized protein LOC118800186 isoform X1 n=1 Tax=Colossoma macropomum TaxID=42526 RepID=UPI0018647254|nr:uncharacterized protein LOC118800186 isoform X1 [Colossoma macropomum]